MLDNAMKYQDVLKEKFYDIWYDERYQYYFGSDWRWTFQLNDSENGPARRDFVSLDKEGNVVGYIGYQMDPYIRLAHNFGAINFTDSNRLLFGRDLRQVVCDIFEKFAMETLEFCVVCGNPIERSYDRIVERIGGRILCVRHARARDMKGNVCDDKVYEITREEYLKACLRMK